MRGAFTIRFINEPPGTGRTGHAVDGANRCLARDSCSSNARSLTLTLLIMKTKNHIEFPRTLRDLYSHPDFVPFGSSSGDWLHDSERMERCHEAAENGCDGSTHAEVMSDWREFLEMLEHEAKRKTHWHPRVTAEIERRIESIREEIDKCEAWHEKAGSLHRPVG